MPKIQLLLIMSLLANAAAATDDGDRDQCDVGRRNAARGHNSNDAKRRSRMGS